MGRIDIKMNFKTLEWRDGVLYLLDQRALPNRVDMHPCRTALEVVEGIRNLTVRGAPAIGVAAAYGVVLSINDTTVMLDRARFQLRFDAHRIKSARPTAVNLMWAVDRMMRMADSAVLSTSEELRRALEQKARAIHREDQDMCRSIGVNGVQFIRDGMNVLTHCNAGALATSGIGTALAPIYQAKAEGKSVHVYADETRPVLQGARLTMWELMQQEIPCTLITDNTAASLFAKGKIDAVIVGADRIAANGDVANKIGTYNVAVLASYHGVPFYVAAPTSTFDDAIASGSEIPIEERSPTEVTNVGSARLAPTRAKVFSPAFDVTPNELITAIISDRGVRSGGRG
jgi:methylthioribose-1-phosphate isomerase